MLLECPICGSHEFQDYNGRENAVCVGCRSLERTRLLWMYLGHLGVLTAGERVLHVAPEKCLTKRLQDIIGESYEAVDFEPARYATDDVEVRQFDMCTDLFDIEPETYDVIMHLHVLEHIPCALEPVMDATMKALKPGGHFLFAVPLQEGITFENLSPDLSREERAEMFGQFDHLRWMGKVDFPRFLARTLVAHSSQDHFRANTTAIGALRIERAAIPFRRTVELSGDTLFHVRRDRGLDPSE